ncbi:DUF1127 domain-containing protein [Muricoccus radiodurans]|uniref:DUF1127 domain-containing protein n=1 Tax=Muricoccus radiodurans TaxID=2231721 RepID=UPI003CED948B
MSGHVIHHPAFDRAAVRSTQGGLWMKTFARMVRAIEERRLLATLDDRMLADIGVSRSEAAREANRAPWDITTRRG